LELTTSLDASSTTFDEVEAAAKAAISLSFIAEILPLSFLPSAALPRRVELCLQSFASWMCRALSSVLRRCIQEHGPSFFAHPLIAVANRR
jgi:hypothetical protein